MLILGPLRDAVDLLAKSLLWNVCLEKNAHIFRNIHSLHFAVILKAIHMFLAWVNAVPKSKRAKLEGSVLAARRRLEFLSDQTRVEDNQTK